MSRRRGREVLRGLRKEEELHSSGRRRRMMIEEGRIDAEKMEETETHVGIVRSRRRELWVF